MRTTHGADHTQCGPHTVLSVTTHSMDHTRCCKLPLMKLNSWLTAAVIRRRQLSRSLTRSDSAPMTTDDRALKRVVPPTAPRHALLELVYPRQISLWAESLPHCNNVTTDSKNTSCCCDYGQLHRARSTTSFHVMSNRHVYRLLSTNSA